MTWGRIFEHWPVIEQDLAEVYGVDVEDDQLLTRRSWRWLANKISGLLNRPPSWLPDGRGGGRTIPSTRLGLALFPPSADREE